MWIRSWLELLFLSSRIWIGSTLVGDGDLEDGRLYYNSALHRLRLCLKFDEDESEYDFRYEDYVHVY